MSERINVVTVTYNNATTIGRLIASLTRQSGVVARVVAVDNGSTDGTLEALRAIRDLPFELEILPGPNAGFAGGYLRAGTESTALDASLDTLCVNPDVELADRTVPALIEVLRTDQHASVVTAPLVLQDGSPDPSCIRSLPRLRGSLMYGLVGKLTPKRFRYNAAPVTAPTGGERRVIEATTGALMLVRSDFRSVRDGIFDTSYWMYGEDLQLCKDAASEGGAVVICGAAPSLHIKGVSSGLPRHWRANVAFHNALALYYRKNLSPSRVADPVVVAAVYAKLIASHGSSVAQRFARSAAAGIGRVRPPRFGRVAGLQDS